MKNRNIIIGSRSIFYALSFLHGISKNSSNETKGDETQVQRKISWYLVIENVHPQ
jgi:hypothetical protein